MDVSIIIVNYNTFELTKNCINSIYKNTKDILFEIILVDNASKDGSFEYFSNDYKLKYIYNKENMGFGRANNSGVKHASGKYLFFLNPDTILLNNAIKMLFDFFEKNNYKNNIGVLGCYLYNEKMEIVNSYLKFPTVLNSVKAQLNIISNRIFKFKIFNHNIINYKGIKDILKVDYIVGASMMIKKEGFNKFEGFDKDYFLYFEETDLQKRMNLAGYKNIIITKPKIIHYESQSSPDRYFYLENKTYYFQSMFNYFKKNHLLIQYLLLKILMIPLLFRFLFIFYYPASLRIKFIKTIIKI